MMRRLLYLTMLAMLAMLVLAPAALAQESFTDPEAVLGGTCPEGFAAFGDPGTGELTCLTQEDLAALEAGTLSEGDVPVFGEEDGICVGPGEGDPDCAAALLESLENQPTPSGAADVVEIAPGGPCATPELAPDLVGVPIEELPNAFLNRNDPVGTPLSSPLDPDGNGIACDHPGATTGTAATPAPAAPAVTVMPDTGGPALLLPVAALLVGSGILGFTALRRRS